MDNKLRNTEGNFLFNVDILINARTNPLALQYLLELLNNNDNVTDFKIQSGLDLGRTIDTLLRSAKQALKQETPASPSGKPSVKAAKNLEASSEPAKQPVQPKKAQQAVGPADAFEQIREYIKKNQLVRLRANSRGKQVSIPCRILNFDEAAHTISVYHVDEKQVYTFRLNEIDEFY